MSDNERNYDTSRWQDVEELITDSPKKFLRKATEKATERQGVLKHVSGNRRRERRF
jgi:hypothetical protein